MSLILDPVALVFRRDVLHRFLSELQRRLLDGTSRNGASLGITDWADREGVGIAVHAPPLVRTIAHDELLRTSENGAARAANDPAAIEAVSAGGAAGTRAKVGLIGWNTASGLGSMNRDLASHGVIDRWLVPRHPVFPTLSSPTNRCRIETLPRDYDVRTLRNWMRGLDWVVFVELPYVDRFAQVAREEGIGVACIPMWELVRPGLEWLRDVDLMLCPNAFAFELFHSWKERYGYGWDVAHVPWAIDSQQFRFRPRSRCERFVFVNGTGGCRAERLNGSYTPYRRKGFELMLATARRLPSVPFLVYTQVPPPSTASSNVEIREHQPERDLLYEDGDVCVQPSHWEGLGLQLLECQAAGMPLITTDAPPMNEFRPFLTVTAEYTEIVTMGGNHPITAHHISPDHLAQVLSRIHGADLREASQAARTFVETEHSWDRAGQILAAHLRVRSAPSGVGR